MKNWYPKIVRELNYDTVLNQSYLTTSPRAEFLADFDSHPRQQTFCRAIEIRNVKFALKLDTQMLNNVGP